MRCRCSRFSALSLVNTGTRLVHATRITRCLLATAGLAWPIEAAAQDDNPELSAPKSTVKALPDSADDEGGDEEGGGSARRAKPLRATVGLAPTTADLGSEADILGAGDEKEAAELRKWQYRLKASLRAAARVSYGDRQTPSMAAAESEPELHAPPRIPGLSSGDWNYIGVAPSSSLKLYVSASNPLVSANVSLSGQPPYDAGFKNLSDMGWFLDAYVTLKFPTVFGNRGGLAWTVGAFGNRYGTAGPKSTGYYGTYLFGKTHTLQEVLTADIDLTDHVELILEHGIGAKTEVIPFQLPTVDNPRTAYDPPAVGAPQGEYFAGQGASPRGSNFVNHAHASLEFDYWLKFGAHYLSSWSPNDHSYAVNGAAAQPEARLSIYGGDVHLDLAVCNGYLGYSRADMTDIVPLDNGLQAIHGTRGTDYRKVYFRDPEQPQAAEAGNATGTVDTVLSQYILKLGNIIGSGPDIDLAAFGMFAHVDAPAKPADGAEHLAFDKLKFGGEAQVGVLRFMSVGFRADRVMPFMGYDDYSYTALSPRITLYSKRDSKEYIIVNYTHYDYGSSDIRAGSPYGDFDPKPDPHLFAISAVMSL